MILQMRNLESGEEKEVYRGNSNPLAVSPDGQWFAFYILGKDTENVMVLDIASGSVRELLRIPPPEFVFSADWTRDGQYLIFAKVHPQQPASLWRIPVKGGEPQRLELTMSGLRDLRGLRVHPDGRQLAFTGGERKLEIWVMENFLPAVQKGKASVAKR